MNFDEYNPPETVKIKSCKKPAAGIERLLYRCPVSGESNSIFSPDGERVLSRSSNLSYKMDIRSRLIGPDGQAHSLVDLYDRINDMPMVKETGSVVLRKYGSNISLINKKHELVELGQGYVELTEDSLLLSAASTRKMIPLDEILTISVEQNHKLTTTTKTGTFQFSVEGGSALQWQKYIRRLIKGEKPVTSL